MAAPVDEPWWASGSADGSLGEEDPLDAHRGARDGARHSHAHGHAHGHGHGASVDACQVCPVCAGIRVLAEARPELVAHLSEAARHLTLAAKAFIDAQAEVLRRDDGLERIDLDDE